MKPEDYDGPFPKRIFPTSVFPRRIFPWMGGEDEEDGADENKHSTPGRQRNNEDKEKEK